MADQTPAFLQQPQFLDPEQQQQLNEIARKQRMAQLLTQTGMTPVQGQMVGNRYVAPSWSQYASQLFSGYSGRKLAEEAESEQAKLAQALKEQQAAGLKEFLQSGKPRGQVLGTEVPQGQLPVGQTAVDDEGRPTLVSAAKPALSYAERVMNLQRTNPQLANQLITDLYKTHNVAEGGTLQRGNLEGGFDVVGQGTPKYHAPISVDAGNVIQLRDPRDPTKVIASIPKAKLGGNTLPEGATKQVTGSVNMVDAINNYQTVLNKYNGMALTPSNRADLSNAYNNMMLQAKEAYNLGVLNGPDYQILQSVVQDPNSFKGTVVDTKALIRQSDALGKTAENTINNAYGVHNVEVPAYVKSKVQQLPHNKQEKTTPSALTASAPIYATNPQTGQRIMSTDGGKTWSGVK